MNNCPTGYCGYPCYCKGSLDHIDATDAKDLIQLANDRLLVIGAKEAAAKFGEAMVPFQAKEIRLKAIRTDHGLQKVDFLLSRVVLTNAERREISELSGVKTIVIAKDGNITIAQGDTKNSPYVFRYRTVNYVGEISATASPIKANLMFDVYIDIVDTTVYLPTDME